MNDSVILAVGSVGTYLSAGLKYFPNSYSFRISYPKRNLFLFSGISVISHFLTFIVSTIHLYLWSLIFWNFVHCWVKDSFNCIEDSRWSFLPSLAKCAFALASYFIDFLSRSKRLSNFKFNMYNFSLKLTSKNGSTLVTRLGI